MTYTASHKQWDHTGHIEPQIELSESNYPAGDFKIAAWLPLEAYDKKFEEYRVMASGQPVALDRQGNLVPAGYKLKFQAAGGSTILTYDATDYANGVIDLSTGVAYATNGTTNYTQTALTTALLARGLITGSETARDFISWPVGYIPASPHQWAGGDGVNPTQFRKHNHILEAGSAFGTDIILQVPMVPAIETTETQGAGAAIADTALVFGTGSWNSATGIHATTRYASLVAATDNVVAMVFGKEPVAKITLNTPIVDSASTLASMTEVDSIAAVAAGGSSVFYIDYEVGVLFLYESGGNAIPTGFSAANTITYYTYENTATGTGSHVSLLGDLNPGDLVTFDSTSNYIKWTPDIGTAFGGASGAAFAADPEYDTEATNSVVSGQLEAAMVEMQGRVLGQVLAIEVYPRGGLDKVMTHYTSLGTVERMPGTATAGLPDQLTHSGGADRLASINFFSR